MNDFLVLLRCLIANTWNLCLTVQVPGLDISFAALFISLFVFGIGIFVLKVAIHGTFSGNGVVQDMSDLKDRYNKG